MPNPIGALLPADEGLTHQIPDTFAVVGTSDPAWTEKVCAMAMARDGRLQLGFGLGRYPNRNVLDGYAATQSGSLEQTTVRASRSLSSAPTSTAVGPIHYEVIEPLQRVRFQLEPNEVQPIAFDIQFAPAVPPPHLEERTHLRAQFRVSADLVRYHQTGVASGWLEIDGHRTEISPDTWVATRDHSWEHVRYDVGPPPPDRGDTTAFPPGVGFMMIWCPALMERPDGSRYALHLHFTLVEAPGFTQKTVIASVEHPDGRVEPIVDLRPLLQFDPDNRRLLGGSVTAVMADGGERPIEIEVLGDTGIQLGAGAVLRVRRTPSRRTARRAPRRRRTHRRLPTGRGGPSAASDPRHGGPGHRPRRRWHWLGQLPAHRRWALARPGPGRRSLDVAGAGRVAGMVT